MPRPYDARAILVHLAEHQPNAITDTERAMLSYTPADTLRGDARTAARHLAEAEQAARTYYRIDRWEPLTPEHLEYETRRAALERARHRLARACWRAAQRAHLEATHGGSDHAR